MGKSQVALAEASGLKQANISTIERKETLDAIEVATLRKYAHALGGEIQLAVVIDGRRYVLTG